MYCSSFCMYFSFRNKPWVISTVWLGCACSAAAVCIASTSYPNHWYTTVVNPNPHPVLTNSMSRPVGTTVKLYDINPTNACLSEYEYLAFSSTRSQTTPACMSGPMGSKTVWCQPQMHVLSTCRILQTRSQTSPVCVSRLHVVGSKTVMSILSASLCSFSVHSKCQL